MRENRTHGSEGGEAKSLPYPYRREAASILARTVYRPDVDGRDKPGHDGVVFYNIDFLQGNV